MRWATPSWVGVVLGGLFLVAGFVLFFVANTGTMDGVKQFGLVAPLLIGGSLMLGAGLLGLQQACGGWCDCCDDGDGCGCCGDNCGCGDCSACGGGNGHEHGEHEHGEHGHAH